jgi:transcriptional regulator with XRE-family HTH domain
VAWWDRPAPDDDDARWEAIQRIQAHRLLRGIPVTEVTRRLAVIGAPLSRETLSRVLNGKQPTTWDTVAHLAEVLGVDVDLPARV